MITNNVIQRTFRIHYKGRNGTCFTITVENEMYLITARHIVEEITGFDFVEIYYDGEWAKVRVNLIGHTSKSVDISVLTGNFSFSADFLMPASRVGLIYGQDVYFLGFPDVVDVDDTTSSIMELNRNFPLPVAKHAIASTMGNDKHFFIDGYGNTGFSGGPVVFKPSDNNNYHVAGVIVNYKPEIFPVYKTELQAKNEGGFGSEIVGYYRSNSGTITVSWIKQAIDLIKNNCG